MAGNSTIFKKANKLMREGYPRSQAFKIAYQELGEPRKRVKRAVRKNPARPIKRKTRATTMAKAKSCVRRPSQASGKAPTKRLAVRRTKNLRVPVGVFPNPRKTAAKVFKVEVLNSTSGNWRRVASFVLASDAKQYAQAYHRAKNNVAVRVMS